MTDEEDPSQPHVTPVQHGPGMRAFPYPAEDDLYLAIIDGGDRGLYFMAPMVMDVGIEDQQHVLQLKIIDVMGLASRRFCQLAGGEREKPLKLGDPKVWAALDRLYKLAKEMEAASLDVKQIMTAATGDA